MRIGDDLVCKHKTHFIEKLSRLFPSVIGIPCLLVGHDRSLLDEGDEFER
jgi:hypothetical protein